MVVKGKSRMPLPESIAEGIARESDLMLLGVAVNKDPCINIHHNMLSSRLYVFRVCKYYGYSLQELTLLFDSHILSLFTCAIKVWVCAFYNKYVFQTASRLCVMVIPANLHP